VASKRRRVAHEGSEADDGSESFATYLEYNRVLRTWFVAFGVGGPAIFLVNDKLAARLVAAQQLRLIVVLFLVGAGAQVLGALTNKVANWYVYSAVIDGEDAASLKYKVAEWLAGQFWIDIVLDVLTIGVFGYSAWVLLTVFATG
jgi:hypothetical protein